MAQMSFRLRIALLSSLISGAVMLTFGYGVWQWIAHERLAAVDREILALAYRHPGWIGNRVTAEKLSSAIEFVFGQDRKEDLLLLVRETGGNTLFCSPHWPQQIKPENLDWNLENDSKAKAMPPDVPAPGSGKGKGWGAPDFARNRGGAAAPAVVFTKIPRFQTVAAGGSTWRLGMLGNEEASMVIGLNNDKLLQELGRMRNVFLACMPLALLLVGGGGWLVAGRAVRPLRLISETAEGVTARGLDQRIPMNTEDPEIARLIGVLNRMMDRLESSFKQAIRFSADASHELKTPLAIMQGELEEALQTVPPGSHQQQVLTSLLEETQRLKSITRSLLLLARADAGQLQLALAPVDLAALLPDVIEDAQVLGEARQLRFARHLAPAVTVQADWLLLQQAIRNLLHNAVKYNETNGQVEINLKTVDGRARIEVVNGGPGISLGDQPKIFNRFFRVDAVRSRESEGVGLGLSLAREIVRSHQGDLVLQESRPGFTCFVLTLPLAGQSLANPI